MIRVSWKNEREKLGKDIIQSLYKEGMIKTWYRDKSDGWYLTSGLWSPFYIQLRPLSSYPKILKKVGYALGKIIKEEIKDADKIIGVAMAGIPIATAITLTEEIPSGFTRKLEGVRNVNEFRSSIEKYGEHALIEGELGSGDNLVVVDDLVTKFDSKLITIEQIKYEVKRRGLSNVKCENVVVLFDREQGAEKSAMEHNIKLHSLIPFRTKGISWLADFLAEDEYGVIVDYLDNPIKYQNLNIQTNLENMAKCEV